MDETANRFRQIGPQPRNPRHHGHPNPAADWALFLDVDGTLLPIAATPDAVVVSARLREALKRAQPVLGGAVALISGRSIATLDRLFAPLHLPAAGLHGLERRNAAGETHNLAAPANLDDMRRALAEFAAAHPGVLIEDKGATLVLHYRQAPAAAAAARDLVDGLVAGRAGEVRVLTGKMMLEIASPRANKGTAIAAFMGEAPFAGRRPVFVGDDVTDEDGFAEVNTRGGVSVRVDAKSQPTAADFQIANAMAVVDWLEALPDMIGSRAAGGRG